jgi:hypothetical protein
MEILLFLEGLINIRNKLIRDFRKGVLLVFFGGCDESGFNLVLLER